MIGWPSVEWPITTSLTIFEFARAIWWYQSRSGMFGVAHVVGHGAGVRLHGRKTSKPCVGGVSRPVCALFARAEPVRAGVPARDMGSTLAPLALRAPASVAVATMTVERPWEPSVRSKPCWARTEDFTPLTLYCATPSCDCADAAAGAHAATPTATMATMG